MKLLLNAAQCTHCKDIIVSKYRYDFVSCSCYRLQIDGGLDYVKISGIGYKSLNIYEEEPTHFLRRECVFWGTNYTKEMVRLSETLWRPIKDLNTGHIEAILKTQHHISDFYKEIFTTELDWRKNE